MKTYRLLPDIKETRGMYWDFEDRVARFCEKYLPDTPKERLIQDIRSKWIQQPIGTGYWLVYNDQGEPCAHLCAYISAHFERPFVQFYQMEVDQGYNLLEVMHKVAEEIGKWVQRLNDVYKASNSPCRITYGESMTWIDTKIYERMFKNLGFSPKASRTVMRWDFSNLADAEAEPRSIALPQLVS